MSEFPALFGSDGHLVGVATFPSDGKAAPIACLMLNFGVTQRIGPHRINVKLARRLALQGVASFRFDLSGVGDSTRPSTALEHRKQSIADMQAAMDYCEATWGITKFAVMGLCSGSVNGYCLSLEDPRVVALLIFDAFSYRTRGSDLTRACRRLLAMPRNPAVFEKAVRWVKRFTSTGSVAPMDIYAAGEWRLTHLDFERAVDSLVDRRVALFFIYTGTLHSVDNGHAQLGLLRRARFLQHVRYEFMADVDHTVTSLSAQERVLSSTCAWIDDVVNGKTQVLLESTVAPRRPPASVMARSDSVANQVVA